MNTDLARQKMIEQQVRTWDVFDPEVLEVLAELPRERFVPTEFESLAFAETEIPIGEGQRMMPPLLEGRLLQALDLTAMDKVLEVGTGSGFLTACLASLADHVTSLEVFASLHARAGRNLSDAGIANIELLNMDATKELPDGRYDAIAVCGSVQRFDPRYVDALKIDGRLFVVVGDGPAMDARLIRKTGDNDWESESLFETVVPPLVNAALPPQFSF